MGKVKDFYAMQEDTSNVSYASLEDEFGDDIFGVHLKKDADSVIVEELFDDETLDEYFGCNLADVDIETFNIKQEE